MTVGIDYLRHEILRITRINVGRSSMSSATAARRMLCSTKGDERAPREV
jgi:hypothetical protein